MYIYTFLFSQGRSSEVTAVLDKKLGDCTEVLRYIGGLLDIERTRYQGIEKLLQKFSPVLSCEGSLVNSAWNGVHSWASAMLVDIGDRVRTLKEFKDNFESSISTWDQTKKKVIYTHIHTHKIIIITSKHQNTIQFICLLP